MIRSYLKNYKMYIAISIILVIIQVWSILYQPQVITDIINELGASTPDKNFIDSNGLLLIIVGIIGLIAGLLNTFVAAKVAQNVGADIRSDGLKKIQTLAFQDIEKFTTSNLVVRLTNDVTQVQNIIMMGITMLTRIPLMFAGAFVLAIIAFPGLWWTIILYVIIVVLLTGLLFSRVTPRFKKMQSNVDSINTIVKENMDGVRVVKSFVREKHEKNRFDKKVDELTEHLISTGVTFSALIPIYMFTANVIIAVALYFVSNWAVDDPQLIGSLISFMTYIMQIMFALMMGGFIMMFVSRGMVSSKRIDEILKAKTSFEYGNSDLEEIKTIEFKNVFFKYDGDDEYSLEDISFKIDSGEKVGIVGSTGSGKTTLVQLLPRLYDVTEGQILINGKDLKDYQEKDLREKISFVLQKAELFSGTIGEVIKQGNKNADDAEIEKAAKQSQAYEFINKKENKFEGEVYQKGANFSGGQKQRLSIARGIVKNPNLLILDDSTSALDARSENLVKEAINNELDGITTIIVAQKISSVVDTNKIIVLSEGKVDAIGTHRELVKNSDVYREIYDTQKGKGVSNER